MSVTRREFVTTSAALFAAGTVSGRPVAGANLGVLLYSYGIRSRAEKDRGFADPVRFLAFAKDRGATAVQVSLGVRTGDGAAEVRKTSDNLGVAVEGIVSPPADDRGGLERFTAELATARACGATVVRTVLSGGRRYEAFTKPEEFAAFSKRAAEMLKRAEPVAREHGVKLAVENHKDFRTDELVDLLKGIASEFVGVCLDTGNNLALLENPVGTVEGLAPFTLTVHLKDMGVEEAGDGFRLSEVPLGQGILDLKAIAAAIRKGNQKARFQLEMITRDPLSIPCLTEKYWATLGQVPGRDLARTLALVRKAARKEPLPRVSGLPLKEQLDAEDANVRASFDWAAKSGLFPA
jgi:sugar phosphate isomerase/epimerase